MENFDWKWENVIVTGGAGFIGSHLVDLLIERKMMESGVCVDPPLIIDNLSRGKLNNVDVRANMFYANMEEGIVRHLDTCGSILFHLAAKVTGIQYNMFNHLDMMNSNLCINTNLSRLLMEHKPKFLVWVSTACVYPHDAPVPTPESSVTVCDPEPTNFGYGVAKWVGEQQARYLAEEYGIPTLVVRFFNAFGPRDYYDNETSHVAPALIRRVMEGDNPLAVWGSGNQTRSLVDARDIAKCLVLLVERLVGDESFQFDVVNIGHKTEVSIRELALTIARVAGKRDVRVTFDTSRPDGYERRAADTTKLISLIGTCPDTPLVDTLSDMVEDYIRQKEEGLIS
jgi:GDP-L-fucose synthase